MVTEWIRGRACVIQNEAKRSEESDPVLPALPALSGVEGSGVEGSKAEGCSDLVRTLGARGTGLQIHRAKIPHFVRHDTSCVVGDRTAKPASQFSSVEPLVNGYQ